MLLDLVATNAEGRARLLLPDNKGHGSSDHYRLFVRARQEAQAPRLPEGLPKTDLERWMHFFRSGAYAGALLFHDDGSF